MQSTPRLAYVEAGTGPVVVLLHPFPLNATVWKPLQKTLAEDYRVIAVDLPGFGASQPPRPFTFDSVADDLHELLSDLSAAPCTLVGLSMGGYTAFAFADKYPEDLEKLVLIDSKAAGDDPAAVSGRNVMIETAGREGAAAVSQMMVPRLLSEFSREQQPGLVRQVQDLIHAASPITIQHALTAMRDRSDRSAALSKISVPTLFVVGEFDKVVPSETMQADHQQVPGSQFVVIPGAGHVSALEKPEQFESVLRKFLQA